MRQQEVIDAALRAIGRNGLVAYHAGRYARRPGFGYGNLSFRFKKKEALLLAAIQYLIVEYEAELDDAAATGKTASERLDNLLAISFSNRSPPKNKLAVWARVLGRKANTPGLPEIVHAISACAKQSE